MRKILLISVVLMLVIFFVVLFYLLPDNQLAAQSVQRSIFEDGLVLTPDATGSRNSQITEKDQTSTDKHLEVDVESGGIDLLLKERPFEVEVFGRVTDAYQQPLEGVYVSEELNQRSTRTDAQGRYRMPVTMPEHKYPILIFLRDGYREERKGVALVSDSQHSPFEINVALSDHSATTSFNGWIGNNFGQGVAGLTVKITSRGTTSLDNLYYAVSTDDYGEFHFEGIRSGVSYKFEVLASEGYPAHVVDGLEVSMQTPRLDLTINKLNLVNVNGMVVDQNLIPIPGLSLTVQNLSTGTPSQEIATDSSGFFSLNQFPAGEVRFSGKVPDFFKIGGITLSNNEFQDLTLIIDRGSRYISGWVSDAGGLPVAQARVTLDAEFEFESYQSYSYRSRRTDTAGRFEFSNLGAIDHVIAVYAKGYQKREIYHSFSADGDFVPIRLITSTP